MLFKSKNLMDYKLHSLDGEIGRVEDFYFDDRHWAIRYLVIDTGNSLPRKKVLISPYAFGSVNEKNREISINLRKSQIENSPSWDTDMPVSRQFEETYNAYYGWPDYWVGSYMWGQSVVRAPFHERTGNTNEGGRQWNSHLRSMDIVRTYAIHAKDGEIGNVHDFVIDDETWAIRYLILNTHYWLPGKKVLISPKWISKVSWESSEVFIDITKNAMKDSPEYSNSTLLNRDYEDKLHKHYNHLGYWIDEAALIK